jgi:tetraacyldisaccharide 4'-kinase
MKILKPIFWEKKNNFLSFLLLPVTFFFQILIKLKSKMTTEISFQIPVVCVGNIYIGGTGKTPLSIMIAEELTKYSKKTAIVKKYYIEHLDEHKLIKNSIGDLFLDKHRSKAIYQAQNKNFDLAVLDDGFQDFSINKDLNILCFNSMQLIGNGMTLPSGPLRERFHSIKRAHIVMILGDKNELFEKKIINISNKIKIYYSKYLPVNISQFRNKKLLAFAGIGNPNNFFQILKENNLDVQEKISYPDHYEFSKLEIQKLINYSKKNGFELITTEKDYFRVLHHGFKEVKCLKNKLEIQNKNNFIKQILNLL